MQDSVRFPRGLAAAGLLAGFVLAACGGGGGGSSSTSSSSASSSSSSSGSSSSSSSGASSSSATTVGAISGFGSVIVNGVRFEDNSARISDDSGNTISSSSLGLGMTVEVQGTASDDGTGTASSISVFSEVQGPLANLNPAAGSFTVLGFTVTTSGATVFEDVSGLAALANGNLVEVHGLRSGNSIAASRIERKSASAGSTLVKLRGPISGLNTGTTTFTLGTATVNYATASVTPSFGALADGVFVKVSSTSSSSGNTVTATRVQVVGSRPFSFDDGDKSELEGVVSDFTSISQFSIAGVTVNAANATFLRGTASSVANGTRLEVKGTFNNNVLTAQKVKFEDGSGTDEFEVRGTVSNFVSLANFVVRGVSVDASGSGVEFDDGSAAQLANGSFVEIEGSLQSSGSGSVLRASEVKFEDGTSSSSGSSSSSSSGSSSSSSSGSSSSSSSGSSSSSSSGASSSSSSGSSSSSSSGSSSSSSSGASSSSSSGSSSSSSSGASSSSSSGASSSSSSSSGELEFQGTVTAVNGNTITVGGRSVTINSSTTFRRITQQQIVVGAFLEIKGRLQSNNSVIAERIKLED